MPITLSRRRFAVAAPFFAAAPPWRRAAAGVALPVPSEKVILTVSGKIGATNGGETARFDRPMLEGLGTAEVETHTPWYTGTTRFEGVPMQALMRAVGASGATVVTAVALNDYSTDLPVEDFARFGVLMALRRDGAYMPVRDKGPLFIVYPYDSEPELQHQRYYSRSAWQVARLVVN